MKLSTKPRVSRAKSRSQSSYTMNPIKIPSGFPGLIIDTREQKPLFRRPAKNLIITTGTVTDGDYTIEGYQDSFCIERKMLSDFNSYVGSEREKTQRKLNRFRDMEFVALVIEADLDDICKPYAYAKRMLPEHYWGFLTAINVRYGVHWFVHNKRKLIERVILDWAVKYWKMRQEVSK